MLVFLPIFAFLNLNCPLRNARPGSRLPFWIPARQCLQGVPPTISQCTSMSQPENTNDPLLPPTSYLGCLQGGGAEPYLGPHTVCPQYRLTPAGPSPPRPRLGFLGLPLSFPLDKHWPARPAPGNQTLARAGHTQYEYLTFNQANAYQ